MGRLTRDPELRYTPKGTALVEIGLAVNRTWTEEGQKREETTFVDVTLWGRTAEIAQQYLHKGSPVFIEGRLQLDTWDDKQTGQKRSKLRIIGENLQLLGSRESAQGQRPPQRASAPQPPRPVGAREPDPDPDAEPEDIPFHASIYRDVKQCRLNRRVF
jgi:single-strand DNA-binding protein